MNDKMNLDEDVTSKITSIFNEVNERLKVMHQDIKSLQKSKWGLVSEGGSISVKKGKSKPNSKLSKKDFIKKYKNSSNEFEKRMIKDLPKQPQQPYFKYGKDKKDELLKDMYDKIKLIEKRYPGSNVKYEIDSKTKKILKVTWYRRVETKNFDEWNKIKNEDDKWEWKNKKDENKKEKRIWSYQSEGSYQYKNDPVIKKVYDEKYESDLKDYKENMKSYKNTYPIKSTELFNDYNFKDPTIPPAEKKQTKSLTKKDSKKEEIIGKKRKKNPSRVIKADSNEPFVSDEGYDF